MNLNGKYINNIRNFRALIGKYFVITTILCYYSESSYLKQPSVDGDVNALDWWHQHQSIYPNLFRMACDYLAIPATSIPSERLFSNAGQLITDRRNCLKANTICACVCLDSWWSTISKFRLNSEY
jgi:hypothetical protein